jgi:hydrogenase maturation factor
MSNNNLIDSLQQSFEYWSMIDEDSRINCLLVWKKILKDNSQILKNQTVLINNIKQDTENQVQQFLESWSHAIEESDFEAAKKSMQKWQDLFENLTNENVKIYAKVLETLETSWENIQSKNID